MNKTNTTGLIRKQCILVMHMNNNFHGQPFADISKDIIREFTRYWKLEVSLNELFTNLETIGLDDDDIHHLVDICFLNDQDIDECY